MNGDFITTRKAEDLQVFLLIVTSYCSRMQKGALNETNPPPNCEKAPYTETMWRQAQVHGRGGLTDKNRWTMDEWVLTGGWG